MHIPYSSTTPQCRKCGKRLDGQEMRDLGFAAALEHAPDDWLIRFDAAIADFASTGEPFTSEDCSAVAGKPANMTETNRNNAIGAMIAKAAKRGQITKVGQRVPSHQPRSHGAALELWKGSK